MMQIPENTLKAVKEYFQMQLSPHVESREIDVFFQWAAEHYLGLKKHELRLEEGKRLTESDLLQFIYCVKGLKKGKPIQCILGETEFYGIMFQVSPDVLIPRPETEELVEWILTESSNNPISCIDIGTGSGCIPITLKKKLSNADIYGLDVSEKAIEVARQNALNNNVEVNFLRKDILEETNLNQTFDVIVSNPPYIPIAEKEGMMKRVTDFEPGLALFVPAKNPFLFYDAILSFSVYHLKQDGALYFEMHEEYASEYAEQCKKLFEKVELRKDMSGKPRMLKLSKAKNSI